MPYCYPRKRLTTSFAKQRDGLNWKILLKNSISKYAKRITLNYSKCSYQFDLIPSLFSSAGLDRGTFQLLESLRKSPKPADRILDLGAGWGPIGIILKKQNPEAEVHSVDRDGVALEYTCSNGALNGVELKVYPSLAYQGVEGKFDLICTNYPAKAGPLAFKEFVHGASQYLNEDGLFVIVIVKELEEEFKTLIVDGREVLHYSVSFYLLLL